MNRAIRKATLSPLVGAIHYRKFSGNFSVNLDTSEATLKRADDALYESKNEGRNRITTAYSGPTQASITLSNSSS